MEEIAENPINILKNSIRNQIIPPSSSTTTSPSRNPRTRFTSHRDRPSISPSARIVCEILTHASSEDVESALSTAGVIPTRDLVEEVLQLSYNSPSAAVDFFRWAGRAYKLAPYEWNLMVDILGQNQMFEQMWDAIRSMKQQGVLSSSTFASVFGSYCEAQRYDEAIMSFDVMNMYGVSQDVLAVNSLLSVICRQDNQMVKALEFFDRIGGSIQPDADSFAILLEGWEKEGNVVEAKRTFGEMVDRFGWSPQHISSYETLLTTLIRRDLANEALKFLKVMKGENCLPGLSFFSNALDIFVKQNSSTHAVVLWDIMCLIKNKKARKVEKFFYEMIKNEWPPTHLNCASAITMLLDGDEPETAIEIWNYMVENDILPLEVSANALLVGLRNMGRLLEPCKEMENFPDVMDPLIMDRLGWHLKNASFLKVQRQQCGGDRIICSKSWKTYSNSDPVSQLRAQACKSFLKQIPLQKSRR
ncbi:hypothetical protein LWI28_016669 [Acer negundo]|uniref:Pentatricopeptide repeat-containing protein n=1 Tax=Acer negundo TaxID=4023 RepID=A0AAD5IV25_ACENE|nr:hypothetical protein LWI28_016669 [Acer negundo]